ncbi:hypothetical protein HOLleu_40594 [Holothuria leucospilota]|uniref:Uncharacterized protein n=1 Tax=Holothuria leucospilota TaxID=206669 RepID=A0A9Q1BD91_HOLLE|nr:hypothetical protein HOLleu_40594 [Holothuria leucospilota]
MRDSTTHHPVMRSLFVTGLFQIVGGMTLFFSGLLLVIMRFDEPYRNRFENPVCGVWTGGFVVIVGIIGVLASGRPGAMRIVYLVTSILTVPSVLTTTVISAVGAADNVHYYAKHPGYNTYDSYDSFEQNEMSITKIAFHLLICFVCATELIIALLVAVFSCNAYCPGTTIKQEHNNAPPPPVTYEPAPSYAYPPPTVANNGESGTSVQAEDKV